MRKMILAAAVTAAFGTLSSMPITANADRDDDLDRGHGGAADAIQLGPRPFYLVEGMDPGPLKDKLMQCRSGPFKKSDFSIGHRGAPLQFPEHTLESYQAAAQMGAGIVECDVTFTSDGALVCRHGENDLHTTTNILLTDLAQKCTKPFSPAVLDGDGKVVAPASAECRASDLTLPEFKSLRGKMDAFNPAALTPEQYVGGTATWRTDLYTGRGTLLTLGESIRLNQRNRVKHTPELKGGDPARIQAVFGGQAEYAQALAATMEATGVRPRDAWLQSFNVNDVLHWIDNTRYGEQAVFLIDYDAAKDNILLFDTVGTRLETRKEQLAFLARLKDAKVRIIAPAMPALLSVQGDRIVPSQFAKDLKRMGFDIITWTFERSDLRRGASAAGFYYDFDSTGAAIKKDSDMYKALDVLAKEVKILGIFSDWPATVTYYANCMKLK
jgi:glycerophosphoryl diester phosphodiesterase